MFKELEKAIFESFHNNTVALFNFTDYSSMDDANPNGHDFKAYGYVQEIFDDGSGDRVVQLPKYTESLTECFKLIKEFKMYFEFSNNCISVRYDEDLIHWKELEFLSLETNISIAILLATGDSLSTVEKLLCKDIDKEINERKELIKKYKNRKTNRLNIYIKQQKDFQRHYRKLKNKIIENFPNNIPFKNK